MVRQYHGNAYKAVRVEKAAGLLSPLTQKCSAPALSFTEAAHTAFTYRLMISPDAGTGSETGLCIWYKWSRRRSSLRHSHSHSNRKTEYKRKKDRRETNEHTAAASFCIWNGVSSSRDREHPTSCLQVLFLRKGWERNCLPVVCNI